MKTRSTVLIVAAAALILGCGLLGVTLVGKGLQFLRRELTSETARIQFVNDWRPPASREPTAVFPNSVVGYRRKVESESSDAKREAPDLGLSLLRGWYERSNRAGIEVFVSPVDDQALSRRALERAKETFQSRSGKNAAMQSSVQTHDRLQLASSNPAEKVEIWILHGWLFYFRSDEDIDPGFIRAYLSAIRGGSGA